MPKDKKSKDEFLEEINAEIKRIDEEYRDFENNDYINNYEDIDELDIWLTTHYYFFDFDLFHNYKNQICITIKNRKTGEWRNKFFNQSKIAPSRESTTPLSYIIYNLSKVKHYDIYISCNMFKSSMNPKRTKENVFLSKVLFIDIDKIKGSEDLDFNSKEYNKKLVELLYKNYPITKEIPPSEIIASGTGLHLYFYVDPFLFTKESIYKYTEMLSELTKLYGGDCNCVDVARILRPPFSYNKKDKFKQPKKVEIVENSNREYTFLELEKTIKKYKNQDEKAEANKKKKSNRSIQAKQAIKKQKKDCNDNFELTQYEEDKNYPKQYLVQDLLYFMKNRSYDCDGVRHNLLFCFYFAFRKYCLMDLETTEEYITSINNLFVEPLTDKELIDLINKLDSYELYKGITNIKVKKMIKMLDEEVAYMKGTYTENKDERKQIKLKRDRRISKQKYKSKKPTRTEIENCILNNPTKTNQQLADLLNISLSTIHRVKRELKK